MVLVVTCLVVAGLAAVFAVLNRTGGFVAGSAPRETTNSGRSRVVSLDAETVKVLKEHKRRQRADQLAVGAACKGGDQEDYVFLSAWGTADASGHRIFPGGGGRAQCNCRSRAGDDRTAVSPKQGAHLR